MGSIFNLEGGFFSGMGKLFDIIAISIIYTICCIPIITIGPATTALYYTTAKSIRRDRGYTTKEFFHAFKQNLRQGIVLGLIYTILTVVMTYNFFAIPALNQKMGSILLPIYIAMSIFIAMTGVYTFPVLSRFTLPLKQIIMNSFFMSIRHIISTVIMLIIVAAAVLSILVFPFAVIIVPGLACLLVSILMERVLKQYIPKDDNNIDAWYLE